MPRDFDVVGVPRDHERPPARLRAAQVRRREPR